MAKKYEKKPATSLAVLKDVFGYDSFRRGQEEIISNILSGRDTLAIMPTGAGKSICYQIPAILSPGVTVILSPLISLMKDQVDALKQNGVPAASINSSMPWEDVVLIFRQVRAGKVKLLYIAPERLESEGFRAFFSEIGVTLVIVDEAHCVSQWGHDFRPAYLGIAPVIASLARRPVVAAFTATATPEVRDDIAVQLRLRDPFTITTGFDRENLFFQVEHPASKMKYVEKHVEKHTDSAGIVYCATRRDVEGVCARLREKGVKAVRYHAGLSDLERKRSQEDFIYDRANVIVATNAFGMGIDKSNVRYVLHYNMPGSMDAYYQEAGRAGRDGLPAECILLFGTRDIITARFFIAQSEDEETKKSGYRKLQVMVDYCNTASCLRSHILRYFEDENVSDTCTACGNCTVAAERVDVTVEAKKILSCVFRMAEHTNDRKYGSAMLVDVLRGSRRAQVISLGFDKISTWGLLKEYEADQVREIVNFLIAEGYLQMEDGEFPVLSFTGRSIPFLRSGAVLMMRQYEGKSEKKLKTSKQRGDAEHSELFEKLRALRMDLAKEDGVPPYVVFSDRTLIAMCAQLPSDEDEMLEVSGVGAQKLEKYGEAFLDAIAEWKEEQGTFFTDEK